jgi:prepilin-type processing-associated H-X9-DG protein
MVFDIWYRGTSGLPLYSADTNTWTVQTDINTPLPGSNLSTPYAIYNKAPHSSGGSYGGNVAYCDGHVAWTPYGKNGQFSLNIWDPLLNYNF